MKKKLYLVLVCLLVLTACGSQGGGQDSSQSETSAEAESESQGKEIASEPAAETASEDLHGHSYLDPYSMDEVGKEVQIGDAVLSYKVDKIYEGDEAIALVEDDNVFKQFMDMRTSYANTKHKYIAVEYTQTYEDYQGEGEAPVLADYETGLPSIVEQTTMGRMGTGDANVLNFKSGELDPMKLGESRTLYCFTTYFDEDVKPKFLALGSSLIFDLFPDIPIEIHKIGEEMTMPHTYIDYPGGDRSKEPNLEKADFYKFKLLSAKKGESAKNEYWALGEDLYGVDKDDPNYEYVKLTYEINFDPSQEAIDAEISDGVILEYSQLYYDTYIHLSQPQISLSCKPYELSPENKNTVLFPGDKKEFTAYLIYQTDGPEFGLPNFIKLYPNACYDLDLNNL